MIIHNQSLYYQCLCTVSILCSVSDFGVLIVALKATINIIHKTMHVIHALLSKETSFTGNDGEGLAIVWQENLSSAQLRKQWVESQLMNSSGVCESLLVRGRCRCSHSVFFSVSLYIYLNTYPNLKAI